jgi:hypothetical protein
VFIHVWLKSSASKPKALGMDFPWLNTHPKSFGGLWEMEVRKKYSCREHTFLL